MEKRISLGKYAYDSNRKVNEIEIDIEITDTRIGFTGIVWNANKTHFTVFGQCQDSINKLVEQQGNETQKVLWYIIHYIWTSYHHSDLHNGTPEQEKILKEHYTNDDRKYYNFCAECETLKRYGVYEVPAEQADKYRKKDSPYIGKPHTYGIEWLTWPTPKGIFEIVNAMLK